MSISTDSNLGADPASATANSLIISGGGTLQVAGATVTLCAYRGIGLAPGAAIDVANGATLTYGGVIANAPGSSAGSLTADGGGTLTLAGENTYTGTTILSAGTVNLGAAETAGMSGPLGKSAASNPGSIVLSGGYLQYSTMNQYDYAGRFSTAAGQQYNVDTNGQAVTWATALNSSGGSLSKLGSGTLTLAGANTFSGDTSVAGGNLDLDNALALQYSTLTSDGVIFDQSVTGHTFTLGGLSGSGNIALEDDAAPPHAVALSVGNNIGSTTYAGVLSGPGSLSKVGSGTLTLSGTNNTYGGGTAVSGGVLEDACPGALPGYDTSSTVTVGADGTLAVGVGGAGWSATNINDLLAANGTGFSVGSMLGLDTANPANATNGFSYGNSIGSQNSHLNMGLTKLGANTLTLAAQNYFTGTTVIDGGVLSIGYDDNLGVAPASATANSLIIKNGGTLLATGNSMIGISSHRGMGLGPGAVIDVAVGTILTYNGFLADATFDNGGSLTKTGGGTLTLAGANTFSGDTSVAGGNLDLDNALALQYSTLTSDGVIFDQSVTGHTFTLGGLSGSGNIALEDDAAPPHAVALSVGNNIGSTTYAGVLSGPGSLSKVGSGTLTLSGTNNTYGGGTAVSGGVLEDACPGALPGYDTSSTVTVGADGTLAVGVGGAGWSATNINDLLAANGTGFSVGSMLGLDTANPANATSGFSYGNSIGSQNSHLNMGLTKLGANTLTLAAQNYFTGPTVIDGGVLSISYDGNLGLDPASTTVNSLIIKSGGTLLVTQSMPLDAYRGIGLGPGAVIDIASDQTLTYDGFIADAAFDCGGSLTETGGGTLMLNNQAPDSTYTGGTNILAGTLKDYADDNLPLGGALFIGASGTLDLCNNMQTVGSLSGGGCVTGSQGGGLLIIAPASGTTSSFTGTITGSGVSLVLDGPGTLILSGANTYTGPTVIDGGVLSISADGNLGADPASATANQVVINSGGTLQATGTMTLNAYRGIGLEAGAGIDVADGQILTYAGRIADEQTGNGGSLTKTGDGTLVLGGACTYDGLTAADSGILVVEPGGSLGGGQVQGNVVYGSPVPALSNAAANLTASATGATLSVQGADVVTPAADLTYTWSKESGPAAVTFSHNGDYAAEDTTATFTQAGTYTFTVTLADPAGNTATIGEVSLNVPQQVTSVAVAGDATAIAAGQIAPHGSDDFSATAYDQFGHTMATTFTWGASATLPSGGATGSAGTVIGGVYTAPNIAVDATVTATADGVSGTGFVDVVYQRPTVNSIEVASTTTKPIDDQSSADSDAPPIPIVKVGTQTANLLVDASPDGDSGDLSYAWSYVALSGGATTVAFDNSDDKPVATFGSAGNYRITVSVSDVDSGLATTGVVDVTVTQTLTNIKVSAADSDPVTVAAGGNETFFADCLDQFGNDLAVQPTVTWSASSGQIDDNGSYTAPATQSSPLENVQITASSGGVSSANPVPDATTDASQLPATYSESITVAANTPPTIATPASAALDPSGLTAVLSVLGADDGGESNLTYTWTVSSGNSSAVSFPPTGQTGSNGTNGASTTTVTFGAAGTYAFTVTIADQGGRTVDNSSSPLTVDVTQVATTISITSSSPATAQAGGPTRTFVATASDQFNNPMSPQPICSWSVTAGRIDQGGVFTPPPISEPCMVTVTSGGASASEAVTITDSSPQTSGRLGDDEIEPLFEQALGSPWPDSSVYGTSNPISAAQLHLNQLLDGATGASLASLPDWTPGNTLPSYDVPTQCEIPTTTATPHFTLSTSWTVGDTAYTAVETDWSTDTVEKSYVDGGWCYDETQTWDYTIITSGGGSQTTASGSLSYVLLADGGTCWSDSEFSVVASTTAGGTCAGGTWTQTTTNTDNIGSAGTASGSGTTISSYTYNQPYSSGTSSQPVSGNQQETCNDHVSYSYSNQSGLAMLESSGSFSTSYSGGGGASGTTWSESEHGGTTDSYDYKDYFSYSGGNWSMNSGTGSATGNGNTYQWQIASGPYSSSGGGGSMTGTSVQSSLAVTSYSYQEPANWLSSTSAWAPVSGTETDVENGWSNSYYNASGAYTIPYSADTSGSSSSDGSSGAGSASGNSPFSFDGGAIQYSGSGTQSESGSDYSSYSSTGNYTLASDGSWQGVSGSGWSVGNGFTSSSYGGSGTYSYQIPSTSGAGGSGSVSGTLQESGSNGSTYDYNTSASLSASGWSQTGSQSTTSFSQSYQSASGSGSFDIPSSYGAGAVGGGFSYSGTTYENNGQSSYSQQSASFTLDSSGNWQQFSGTGSDIGHTWQSSSQTGSYSHVVSGVTLSGSFSQSASMDDSSSDTTGGSVVSGQWVSSGSGSDTLTTSSNYSYSGSGSATATLSAMDGWRSSGTQSESVSASTSASHSTSYSLGSDGSWEATGGSGSTSGSGTTLAGYSGSGQYTSYSGSSGGASGGSIQGNFSQSQSNTTSYTFNTDDSFQPPSSSGDGGFWQATDGSGSTVDSGGSSFSYSGSGSYGGASGPSGTMSQSGGANESFSYTKIYSVDGSGNWQVSSGQCSGGASGSGSTFASYAADPTPYSTTVDGLPVSGSEQLSGSNDTSYSFQTTATYNGIDWSEVGDKTSSGSGSSTDSFSAQSGNLSFPAPYGSATGSARASGATTHSYSYTEHAFLDDNGAWQNGAASGADGSGSVGVDGSNNWSYSGNGPCSMSVYGNTDSGTQSVSGNQTDSYNYNEYYTFCPDGTWLATSGNGSASGSQSSGSGYAANGGYSSGGTWSGTTSAFADNSTGYDYSTYSTFNPNDVGSTGNGWSTTGNASASSTGSAGSSFSGSLSTYQMTVYGNEDSGTQSASGKQKDSYQYSEYYDLTPAGSWQATRGNGSASGNQSSGSGYAASGGYSTVDPQWSTTTGSGTAQNAAELGNNWSGTTSASAANTLSYGYATNSVYTPASGWTSTGNASATSTGCASSSFSASSPYSACSSYGAGTSVSISGTASGNGSDTSSYRYTQTTQLQPDGTWATPASGWGNASGSSNAEWSYAGSGSYSKSAGGGAVNGTVGESGSESYSLGYNTTATFSSGSGWSQAGSGSASAGSTYNYSYAGSGTGAFSTNSGSNSGTTNWDLNEHGGGSGTSSYSEALTLASGSWTAATPTLSASSTQENAYVYGASYVEVDGGGVAGSTWNTNINDDEITNTAGSYNFGTPKWVMNTTYGGSGSASGSTSNYNNNDNPHYWAKTVFNTSWWPVNGGTSISGNVSVTATGSSQQPSSTSYAIPSQGISNTWLAGNQYSTPPWSAYNTPGPAADNPGGLVTSGGVDLPGMANPGPATAPAVPAIASFTSGTPTLPGSTASPGTPTLPGATSITSALRSTGSLAGFAPLPVLVDGVFGMAFTSQTAPQTPFALGSSGGFSSETMPAADAVLGADNVAPVFPVTRAGLVLNYGLNGVSAGPNAPADGEVCDYSGETDAMGLAPVTSGDVTDVSAGMEGFPADFASLGSQSSFGINGLETFDSQGNLASLTNADGGVTRFGYDSSGNLTSLTDPNQNTTTWAYNSQNNITQQTDAQDNSASLVYNSSGQLTSYTDQNGNVRTYQYDSAGHVTAETLYATAADAAAGQNAEDTLHYAYDASGNMTSESGDSSSDAYTYDSQNRLTSATEASVGSPTVVLTYTYAATGAQPTGVAATIDGVADYQDAYSYNSQGQLTVITRTGGSGGDAVADETVDLTYNAAGQIQTIDRYQGGQVAVEADYTYDSASRLASLVYDQGTTVLASYSYSYAAPAASSPLLSGDGQGVRATWLPGGATLPATGTQSINTAGLDQAISPEQLVAGVMSLDGSVAYSYDAQGQLTVATYSGTSEQPNESYSYDANGNRTNSTSSAAVVIGTNNEVLFDGTYTYTYDANGNETARFIDVNGTGVLQAGDTSVTQYTWDADNRLVQVTQTATYGGTPTQTVVYLYDAEGRWLGENIENGAGVVTHETRFVYDGDQIVMQFDENVSSGTGSATTLTAADLSHRYLWGPAVDQLLSDEQVTSVSEPGTVVLPLTDNLGTVRDLAICDLTSGTTTVVNHLDYNSFGQLLSQTNPATGNAAAVDCLFGFTGRAFDTNTGLQNNLNRWYDASVGRWISPDPTGFAAGDTNTYRYVGNSPANATDPRGLLSLAEAIADGNLTVGKILQLSLTDAEVRMIIKSAGADATFWTADNLDEYHRKEADKEYPALTPSVRYWAEARQINQNEAKWILTMRTPAFRAYVTQVYELLRGLNPPHFAGEKGFALGAGKEPVLGNRVSRLRTVADLALYIGTIKGADWLFGKIKGATLGSGALAGESAELNLFRFPNGGSLEIQPGLRPGMYSADQVETAITQATYGCDVTITNKAITAQFNPTLKGPLPATIVADFTGGSYSQVVLGQDVTLYRVYGGTTPKIGPWWSRTPPNGPLQSQMDFSLPPGNPGTKVVTIRVPKGTVIFEGRAAAQLGKLGGGDQIYIQEVKPTWEVP